LEIGFFESNDYSLSLELASAQSANESTYDNEIEMLNISLKKFFLLMSPFD